MSKKQYKKLILLDTNALIHRAFHALPPLTTKDGVPSGAVYGVALTLLSVIEKEKPDYILATFDVSKETFRTEKFKDYKANRVKAPDELYVQIPLVRQMMEVFGVPVFAIKGYEADDLIGTIVKKIEQLVDIESLIVTGDMDSLQLVSDKTKVYMLRKGIKDVVIYDKKETRKRFNIRADQVVDYKALRGDASDNIPGVKGVGEKTAITLLDQFDSLKKVYENIDKVKESVRRKLEVDRDNAFLSYELATIKTDVDLNFDLKKTTIKNLNKQALADFFSQMGFRSLISRVLSEEELKDKIHKQKESQGFKVKKVQRLNRKRVVDEIRKKGKFAYSFFLEEGKIKALAIYSGEGETMLFTEIDIEIVSLFNDNEIEKIGFDTKEDLKLLWIQSEKELKELDIFLQNKKNSFLDVQLTAYVCGLEGVMDLEKMIWSQFGSQLEHSPKRKGQVSLFENNKDNLLNFCAERAFWNWRLMEVFQEKVLNMEKEQEVDKKTKHKVRWLLDEVELPLRNVLVAMEIYGVKIQDKIFHQISFEVGQEIEQLEKEIYQLAGEEFNINSPNQLGPILYQKLKISTVEIKKGKTGFSTDADQLRKIRDQHPIVSKIESYRELFKVKSTYAESLAKLSCQDGRIHASFNQAVTATGRLSSSDPNLQNIPKKGKWALRIREAFIAEKGNRLVAADYSQIDLRVAAHLSNDQKMIRAFQEGRDIHKATASWVAGIDEEKVSDEQRGRAKALNFGVLYGMGVYGFMRSSGLSREKAQFFIDSYKKSFSGLSDYLEEIKEVARNKGFVETPIGRRRYIKGIDAGNSQVRFGAERMAINLPIQGFAADLMKISMVRIYQDLISRYNKSELKVKMILQIHDEVIFEVDGLVADQFENDLKKIMENVYKLSVPLLVETSQAKKWSEL